MKRAIWVVIGMGTVISGAAAIGIEAQSGAAPAPALHVHRMVAHENARRAQRDAIEARYQLNRSRCDSMSGVRRDNCLIDAHARKGLAMLEAATPYQQ